MGSARTRARTTGTARARGVHVASERAASSARGAAWHDERAWQRAPTLPLRGRGARDRRAVDRRLGVARPVRRARDRGRTRRDPLRARRRQHRRRLSRPSRRPRDHGRGEGPPRGVPARRRVLSSLLCRGARALSPRSREPRPHLQLRSGARRPPLSLDGVRQRRHVAIDPAARADLRGAADQRR